MKKITILKLEDQETFTRYIPSPVRGECFLNVMKKMYRTIRGQVKTLRYNFFRYATEITQGERN